MSIYISAMAAYAYRYTYRYMIIITNYDCSNHSWLFSWYCSALCPLAHPGTFVNVYGRLQCICI